MSKRVDLVFRSVGERTAEASLALAKRSIQPDRVHVLRDIKPFRRTVEKMLEIEHTCDTVVHMDADCLIYEDLRPFIEWNNAAYVDCYVHDRFRGAIHCGVHITRADIVRRMRDVRPADDDLAYVLRPESRVRNLALKSVAGEKRLHGFRILHDYHQSFASIWEKYALRELRSRTPAQQQRLQGAMKRWNDEDDYRVARDAVAYAREHVADDALADDVHRFIVRLPELALERLSTLGIEEKAPLSMEDAEAAQHDEPWLPKPKHKVFGLGLSRTGTRSLTAALHTLGVHCVHYPTDEKTLADLERGDGDFDLCRYFDGLTDITVAPYYADLDRRYPGSKFVLTVRDTESWLESAERHWTGRPPYDDPSKGELHLKIRRFLRAATYGSFYFDRQRFAHVYETHVRRVKDYFKDRPADLLVLPVTAGAGWGPLCEFLGRPVPDEPFPHKGGVLSGRTLLEVSD